jgi:hypothetical protein
VLSVRALRAALILTALLVPQRPASTLAAEAEDLRIPGFLVGQARFPASNQEEERHDFLTEMLLQQGIELWRPTPGLLVRPYAQLELSVDTEQLDFNNFARASIGGEVEWRPAPWAAIAVGSAYELERRYLSDETQKGPAPYLRWSASRRTDLSAGIGRDVPLQLVAFTWGEFRYPAKQEEIQRDAALLQGRAEVGVDWPAIKPFLRANTFVELAYKWDTAQLPFNNKVEPAIGAKLKVRVAESAAVELGVKYLHEYRFVSDTHESGPVAFLNWYLEYE